MQQHDGLKCNATELKSKKIFRNCLRFVSHVLPMLPLYLPQDFGGHGKQVKCIFLSLFQSHVSRLIQIDIYARFLKVLHDSIWSSVHALSLWKSIIARMWPGMDFSIKKSIRFDLPNTVKHFKPFVHTFSTVMLCITHALQLMCFYFWLWKISYSY